MSISELDTPKKEQLAEIIKQRENMTSLGINPLDMDVPLEGV